MTSTTLNSFSVVGLILRTTNGHNQAAVDIPALWQRFMTESIISQIPSRIDDSIYAVYTNYDTDYTGAYDMVLGCRVDEIADDLPVGLTSCVIASGNYKHFDCRGDLTQGAVIQQWEKIWKMEDALDRVYKTDYEVYTDKTGNMHDATFEIFIGVK